LESCGAAAGENRPAHSGIGVDSGRTWWVVCGQATGARGEARLARRRSPGDDEASPGDGAPARGVVTAEAGSPGPATRPPPTTGNGGAARRITGYDVTNCRVKSISAGRSIYARD